MACLGVINPLLGSAACRREGVTFQNGGLKWPCGDSRETYKQRWKQKDTFSHLSKEKLY